VHSKAGKQSMNTEDWWCKMDA